MKKTYSACGLSTSYRYYLQIAASSEKKDKLSKIEYKLDSTTVGCLRSSKTLADQLVEIDHNDYKDNNEEEKY